MSPSDEPKTPAPSELSPLLTKVLSRLGGLVLEHTSFRGDDCIHVARENLLEAARALRDTTDLGFDLLLDVTCIDYFGQPDGFFNGPEAWDRDHEVIRRRAQWRDRKSVV